MNNDAIVKIHEIIKTSDKVFKLVKVGSGNTKELVHVAIFFFILMAFEWTKNLFLTSNMK